MVGRKHRDTDVDKLSWWGQGTSPLNLATTGLPLATCPCVPLPFLLPGLLPCTQTPKPLTAMCGAELHLIACSIFIILFVFYLAFH